MFAKIVTGSGCNVGYAGQLAHAIRWFLKIASVCQGECQLAGIDVLKVTVIEW